MSKDKLEIWIKGNSESEIDKVKAFLKNLSNESPGKYEIIFYAEETKTKCKLASGYNVSKYVLPSLWKEYGSDNIKVVEEIAPPPTEIELWQETNLLLKAIAQGLDRVVHSIDRDDY